VYLMKDGFATGRVTTDGERLKKDRRLQDEAKRVGYDIVINCPKYTVLRSVMVIHVPNSSI